MAVGAPARPLEASPLLEPPRLRHVERFDEPYVHYVMKGTIRQRRTNLAATTQLEGELERAPSGQGVIVRVRR